MTHSGIIVAPNFEIDSFEVGGREKSNSDQASL